MRVNIQDTLNMNATFFLDEDEQQSGHEIALDSWMSQANGVSVENAAKGLTAELTAVGATEGATAHRSARRPPTSIDTCARTQAGSSGK